MATVTVRMEWRDKVTDVGDWGLMSSEFGKVLQESQESLTTGLFQCFGVCFVFLRILLRLFVALLLRLLSVIPVANTN